MIVPCYLMVIVLLSYFSYAGITAYLTPSFDSLNLISGMSSPIWLLTFLRLCLLLSMRAS